MGNTVIKTELNQNYGLILSQDEKEHFFVTIFTPSNLNVELSNEPKISYYNLGIRWENTEPQLMIKTLLKNGAHIISLKNLDDFKLVKNVCEALYGK